MSVVCVRSAAADVANMVGYYMLFENENGDCSAKITDLLGHLVSVDLKTGTLLDEPYVCDLYAGSCPWSIQFWDGQ